MTIVEKIIASIEEKFKPADSNTQEATKTAGKVYDLRKELDRLSDRASGLSDTLYRDILSDTSYSNNNLPDTLHCSGNRSHLPHHIERVQATTADKRFIIVDGSRRPPHITDTGDFTILQEDGEITILHYRGHDRVVAIPHTIGGLLITRIGKQYKDYDGVFENNTTLEEVYLPKTVRHIESNAIRGATNLKLIAYPGLPLARLREVLTNLQF